jgi:hypothetical protein
MTKRTGIGILGVVLLVVHFGTSNGERRASDRHDLTGNERHIHGEV